MDLKEYIATIKDFPEEGILFRDVTPLLQNAEAFNYAVNGFVEWAKSLANKIDIVAGPEARGFLFGCPTAYVLNAGFVPVRKPNKLPREFVSMKYGLEYGKNEIQIHKDSIKPGQKVIIIDDLLATGGTAAATVKLVEELGGEVVGIAFAIELTELHGRDKFNGYTVYSMMKY